MSLRPWREWVRSEVWEMRVWRETRGLRWDCGCEWEVECECECECECGVLGRDEVVEAEEEERAWPGNG